MATSRTMLYGSSNAPPEYTLIVNAKIKELETWAPQKLQKNLETLLLQQPLPDLVNLELSARELRALCSVEACTILLERPQARGQAWASQSNVIQYNIRLYCITFTLLAAHLFYTHTTCAPPHQPRCVSPWFSHWHAHCRAGFGQPAAASSPRKLQGRRRPGARCAPNARQAGAFVPVIIRVVRRAWTCASTPCVDAVRRPCA